MTKSQRHQKNIVLKKLYTISVYDEKGQPVKWTGNTIPKNPKKDRNYEFETHPALDYDNATLDLTKLLTPSFLMLIKENRSKYDKIFIDFDIYDDHYVGYAKVIGRRLETDVEYEKRLKKEETIRALEKSRKEENERSRKAQAEQKEFAEFQKLKEKYEGEE